MQNRLHILSHKYINSYLGLSALCWGGILLSLFESALVGIFYFLSIYFVKDLHLSVGMAGTIISVYGVGAVFGGYIGGVLSDRFSPVIISSIALLLQGLAYFALIKLVAPYYLMLNAFVIGFSAYVFITSNHLFVLYSCQNDSGNKVKALNLLSTSSNLGSGISGLLLGYFLGYGFHNVFLVTAVLLLLLALTTYFVDGSMSRSSVERNIGNSDSRGSICYFDSASSAIVLVAVFIVGMVVSQLGTSYPLYLQEKFQSMGMSSVSTLFAINSFLVVLIANPVGEYCDQFNKLLMVGVGGFLICMGMFILSLSSLFAVAVLACVVFTFGETIFFSMAQFVCFHAGNDTQRGKNLGLFRTVYAGSRIVGPLSGGYIYQHLGGDMVWYMSGLIGIFCVALFAYALARVHSPEPNPCMSI